MHPGKRPSPARRERGNANAVELREVARLPISVTLAASLVLHAAFWAFVLRAQPRPPADDAPREDPWSGDGLEVDAIREPAAASTTTRAETADAPRAPAPEPAEPPPGAPPRPAAPEPETSPEGPPVSDPRPARPEPAATAPSDASASPTTAPSASPLASAPSRADSTAPAESESSPSGAGVFGSAGLPPGVRHLALAFARALPKGAHTDAAFRELPLGKLGEARIRLRVDEDGKLGTLELVDERARETLPAPIVRMLENALRLLSFGRFSLSTQKLEPGVLSLRVRVEISEEAPSIAENAQPNHVRELKGPASGAENPKRAWFVLNSGRRVDAWVHEE
jgi:hypothetical protein